MGPDELFMKEALRLARKGLGHASPNPMVGALIVRNGQIVARGYHRRAGANHAEVEAIGGIGGRARKRDTLYVTLEPCNHQGRTPPCTEAILEAGIGCVVVGMKDPNPKVKGGGCEYLREKGLEVKVGVLEEECRRLNESYLKFVTAGRPFVIAKSAMTMDGWTATSTGHSKWITNERSRRFVHLLRQRVDGVMVGVGTILKDDPLLTTRLKGRKGRDPIRIVVDTHLRTPPGARIFETGSGMTVIAVGEHAPKEAMDTMRKKGVKVVTCPVKGERVDLEALMDILGGMSLASLLLEGGATLMGSMLRAGLVDKFYLFMAPRIMGGGDGIPMASGPGPRKIEGGVVLGNIRVRRFGDDLLIRGYPVCSPA